MSDFNYAGLTYVRSLIFYDFPLLSLHQHVDGKQYLMLWVDIDETTNVDTYLLIEVTPEVLAEYEAGRMTLRQVIVIAVKGRYVHVGDFDDEDVVSPEFRVSEIPEDRMPTHDSYFFTGE